jgi:gamma-glutamylcyclotransferase
MSSNWFDIYCYGSNMAIDRLRLRAPSARLVGTGCLRDHSLRWHKRGLDGSGKCNALFTGNPEDILWGAVFRIKACDRFSLDQAEHLGIGYQIRIVEVNLAEGPRSALMYAALQIQPKLRPFSWYRAYVARGARELGLPPAYIRRIEAVGVIPDPDQERAALHHSMKHQAEE